MLSQRLLRAAHILTESGGGGQPAARLWRLGMQPQVIHVQHGSVSGRTLLMGEQAELVHPGDRRSARGDAELAVDRDRLCLHGVPGVTLRRSPISPG